MRTARRIVRPLRRIRTAPCSRPRAVRAQVFIPVLLALLIPGHCATQTIAPARAERDAVRRQDEIGFTPGRNGQRRHQRIARHPHRPRIRRIERAPFVRRSELHPSAAHTCRMSVIPSSRTPLRAKHVGTGRPIGQRIPSRGMGGGNRKRARDRGGGREADGAIHGRSEAGDVHWTRTADHWLAAERRGGVEAALKRLRGAANATCREAGWIAEASSHYFTEISRSFQIV